MFSYSQAITNFDGCWTKEEAEFFRSIDRKVMSTDTPILNLEETQKQLDGSTSTLLTSKVPLHDQSGNVIGILGIYTDISDRKNMEIEMTKTLEELKEAQEHLIHSEKIRSLGEMASGIAHEINNPLSVVLGNLGILKKMIAKGKIDLESFENRIDQTISTAQRIAKITNNMRYLSRDASQEEVEEIHLGTFIEDLLLITENNFKNNGIKIEVASSGEHREINLRVNKVTLLQALLNILNNARDAIETQASAWIRIESELSEVFHLRIIDSGKGIPDKIVKDIFNPFFTTKDVNKGTGMGLSISKKLLNKMDGDLHYKLLDGHTCFEITLPWHKA